MDLDLPELSNMNDEIIKKALAYSLGADLHENWRLTRKKDNGKYWPKLKKSKDLEWNNIHQSDTVDIANTPFSQLPSNLQKENYEAAYIVINLVYDKVLNEEPINNDELEQMGSIIHNEWLKRNTWVFDSEFGNAKLALPYDKLPKEEQDKDKSQIRPAIIRVNEFKNGNIDILELCEQYNIKINNKVKKL